MPVLPDYLQPFEKQAEKYLSKGLVRDVEFSGGTYQVQVIDEPSGKPVWTFIQLDPRGNVKDCFCSCEDGEELTYCIHLAAALLRIYNHQHLPLHLRFQQSLWNHLCQLFCDRMGDDPDSLVAIKSGSYVRTSSAGKVVFSVTGLTAAAKTRLYNLIEKRPKETEETSLRFSNLTTEELQLWREGRPTAQLTYELSFWNDLAHWCMELQDLHQKYQITFEYSSRMLPNYIDIAFQDLALRFYLSEANLPAIIQALDTVQSPLKIQYASQQEVDKIVYEKKEGALLIEGKPLQPTAKGKKQKATEIAFPENGISIGKWLYVPKDGFYSQDPHQLVAGKKLTGDNLVGALNEHFSLIQKTLEGATLHRAPIKISYSLAFDANWNLHITGYAFSPGDLTTGDSRYFGSWIYLDDDGFYPIVEAQFADVETVILNKNVPDFIRSQRSWLNTQEGFHVHYSSIEMQLAYSVSNDNRLKFERLIHLKEREGSSQDFGPWVYVTGQGFYSKVSAVTSLPLKAGMDIPPDQVPLFIRMNRFELQLIPNFFTPQSPVMNAGLKIELIEEGRIGITPDYQLSPNYIGKDVRFFDDFVYVAGEGFSELPKLPESYRYAAVIEPEKVPFFLKYELEVLQEYATHVDPQLIKSDKVVLTIDNIAKDESKEGWYALELSYQADKGSIPLVQLWKSVHQKDHYYFSSSGLIDLTDSRFDWLRLLPKNRLDKRSNTIHLPTLELIRLNALEKISIPNENKAAQEIVQELSEFRLITPPVLTGLKSELRPYQELGVNWLWFLYEHGLSGLLCDDMGLGKTHQTMALLCAIANKYQTEKHPEAHGPHFLIVCPTSVMYHWQEKLEAFLPHLRVCTFYGSERSLDEFHRDYDILLTSYGIWRIENKLLSTLPFEVAVFDEIQIAKNDSSRIHSALSKVTAKMRVGLTGTPIENHLRELKALFDIVLPTYMPNDTDYRELFVKPIERENNKDRKELLKRFINPFILRRKKENVLPDLPEKTEEVAHCSLLPTQQVLYNDLLHQSRKRILEQLEEKNSPIPYIHIFALLAGLKQICNHPAAFLKIPNEYKKYESGKWDLFIELLSEARESQQKVVVFSQYLAMLDIFEDYLNEIGVGFAAIRGATRNRGDQVRRFNTDPACEVFLGSLQASGLGVDLTAGSVVIHYDRWWNAARENQATDRVHRIGQTRGVQVFKLVTKGTFEERIDALIEKKGQLMEEVVGPDDHRFLKVFNRDELIQLLQDVEEVKGYDTG